MKVINKSGEVVFELPDDEVGSVEYESPTTAPEGQPPETVDNPIADEASLAPYSGNEEDLMADPDVDMFSDLKGYSPEFRAMMRGLPEGAHRAAVQAVRELEQMFGRPNS